MSRFLPVASFGRVSGVVLMLAAMWTIVPDARARLAAPAASRDALAPTRLSVEHDYGAPFVTERAPRLGWIPSGSRRGLRQTAYRIMVSSSPAKLDAGVADLWDSGKIASPETLDVPYDGKALSSGSRAHWKVMLWDERGAATSWSVPGRWLVGPITEDDWRGSWISHDVDYVAPGGKALKLPPSPIFRKSFQVGKPVVRATLYVTALGLYKFSMNGVTVGDDFLAPGWTDYTKRLHYRGYDVTQSIRRGENVMGSVLADGWYSGYVGYGRLEKLEKERELYGNKPWLRAYLDLELADGSREYVGTDASWKASTGGTREADILMGEAFDARLEPTGWNASGFDDRKWVKAIDSALRLRVAPVPELAPYPGSPVKVRERIRPVSVREPKPGVYVFDVGKNLAGVAQLNVRGSPGTTVRLRFAEMVDRNGEVITSNLREARATDFYTLKGDPRGETWTPSFTYHGFRYVEVTGYPGRPTTADVTVLQISSDAPDSWKLSVSGDRLVDGRPLTAQLLANIRTTQLANFIEVPTDCPQRDERLGWTGDAQLFARSSTYLSDVRRFMAKWLVDLDDAQTWGGIYPNHAPAPYGKDWVSPGYMDAGIIVPYEQWRTYGDKRLLERLWPGMNKFMAYQARNTGPDLIRKPMAGFGDWLFVGKKTSDAFISAAYYVYDLKLMAEMAAGVGTPEEARQYRERHASARDAFAAAFIKADGRINDDTQTSYALALYMDLYPADSRNLGARRLAELIKANGGVLATGFLGTKALLPALSNAGQSDLAYQLLLTTKYPSWGYEIKNGATSIWERWNSYSTEKGLFNENLPGSSYGMNSLSHYAFGSVAEWMFEEVGGIKPLKPGFAQIEFGSNIRNSPYSGVSSTYRSTRGDIVSSWTRTENRVRWHVTVPPNTDAEMSLPVVRMSEVRESGVALTQSRSLKVLSVGQAESRLGLSSGSYVFEFLL